MDKLQQLIEWMEEEFENELGEDSISIGARGAFRFCLSKAKQLQAEPTEKVYSEEDMHIIVGKVAFDVRNEGFGGHSVSNSYARAWVKDNQKFLQSLSQQPKEETDKEKLVRLSGGKKSNWSEKAKERRNNSEPPKQ